MTAVVSAELDAFRQGLRELGYVEGRNITIEYRFAGGQLEVPSMLIARADEVIERKRMRREGPP